MNIIQKIKLNNPEKENLQKTSGIAAYHNNAANRNACTAYPGISNREIKQH